MMLKWIYNLGVEHENQRIRGLISEFQLQATKERLAIDERFGDSDRRPGPGKIHTLEVNSEAMALLSKLLQPEDGYVTLQAPIDVKAKS